MTPYRISAREEKRYDQVPVATAIGLRIIGGWFAIAAAGAAGALTMIGGNDIRCAVGVGVWVDRGLACALPFLALALGLRAARGTTFRSAALFTSVAWFTSLAGLAAYLAGVNTYALAVGVSLARVLSVAAVALLPLVATSQRVIPRWPLFASIALAAADASRKLSLAGYSVLPAQFDPSLSTIALCALLAYAFLAAARELRGESIEQRAGRLAPTAAPMFESEGDRAAFLGPVRLATDAAFAFAIAAFVTTTTTVAYSRSFRLDTPAAGPESSALVVVMTAALIWLKQSSKTVSYAPIVAGIAATLAAVFSTLFLSGAAFSVALLPLGITVVGLVVVAPRTKDARERTMRRWVTFVSATGVLLASAGFFSIYSANEGEPALSRLAKLGAVVFGVMAARASARIELHARIELAAEQQRT